MGKVKAAAICMKRAPPFADKLLFLCGGFACGCIFFDALSIVNAHNCLLDFASELCINGMCHIAVSTVCVLTAGHYDKIFTTGVNYLDVMDGKLVVKCNRDHRLHWSVVEYFTYSDVGNFHVELLKVKTFVAYVHKFTYNEHLLYIIY